MIIYKITNLKNNRCYIGRTVMSLRKRWNKHVWCAVNERHPNIAIHNAIRKYGKENFTIEALEECGDLATLLGLEKRYIKEYLENDHRLYNLTLGGDGSLGLHHTLEARKKISINQISRNLKGKCWSRTKKCIIDGIEYSSQTEAARCLKIARNTVHRWVKSGRNGRIRAVRSDNGGFKEGYKTLN